MLDDSTGKDVLKVIWNSVEQYVKTKVNKINPSSPQGGVVLYRILSKRRTRFECKFRAIITHV